MASESRHYGVLKLDATTGASVVTVYTSQFISITPSYTKNTGEFWTPGGLWPTQTEGGMALEWSLKVAFDTSASHLYNVLADWLSTGSGARTLEVYTTDGLSGSRKISGEAIIAGVEDIINIEAGSGDPKTATFKLRHTGTVTSATVV